MRWLGLAPIAALAVGCASTRLVERDGCWIRRSESLFGQVKEELGPCSRPAPQWSQDRLTRLVQECIVAADARWHARALEVWSRRLPYATPLPTREEQMRACMEETHAALAAEDDALRARLGETSAERDALRADVARDRAQLQESHDRIASWLGAAAQKPPGAATATASSTSSSDGTASTDSGTTLSSESGSGSPLTASAPAEKPPIRTARRASGAVRPVRASACTPPAGAAPCAVSATPAPPSSGTAGDAP